MAPAPPPQTSASSLLNPPASITTLLPLTVAKAIETASATRIPSIEILPPKSTSAPKSIPISTFSTSIISKTSSTISSTATASATSTADKGVFTRPSGSLTAIITYAEEEGEEGVGEGEGDLERERVRQMREREAIEMAGRMRERSRERMREDGWEDGWEDVLLHGRHKETSEYRSLLVGKKEEEGTVIAKDPRLLRVVLMRYELFDVNATCSNFDI
ncbi:uncharacterized protein EAF02_008511 [Botrytis sinoallii]|uniref:uncharacterized protein n=1 Tax=Botrytis sinoallii TaxID=1463999 RepID=UPI0018FFA460|nr:uncharacterized protein EAF02_008511 [Botrytis sinoallii]KAF7874534.1 hypothetical protein EAF02_008511 [Botrytis sinoallii]